ncbi:SusC/RagA family TonB-linked outer membrane protein [Daejeonella lutea]|uniref:TonB-linked outer membrane protein, SusC/RagA family n=1 Tax=Daejeonella lutea TaxID=572036 RepID=A0A1T5BKC1_9SPHI|nr:SusC/RagA family TonB-linked outer membrane protein [Daejeonella lutea]SKB47605.1 TonB-linked outer membrane protein, SusC/RagA family [Daejeonella lutea]
MTKKFTRLIARRFTKSGYAYCLGSLFFIGTTASAGAASLNSEPANAASSVRKADIVIRGNVKDEGGVTLPGVSVKVKGASTSTSTDNNGNFTINVPGESSVLVFTYVGFTSQEIVVGSQTNLNVRLAISTKSLEEVVVVGIGYGTQGIKEVTSAVAHVGPEQFRQSGSRNPLDLIQGKVAGLNLTRTSGSNPNSGVSIQLRGVVSVAGSASPLFVIDGIPGANADLLQQDDIESIDVLKDGSGAAIYGTSANAGVIIITTKKGRPGPPRFDYNSYLRTERLGPNRREFLTADEFRQKIKEGQIAQQDFGSSTDFLDQLINHDNLSQNHNLSMSGGSDKTSYRASLNFRNLEGISKENSRKEYALRLNMNQKGLQDKLNVQLNLVTNFNNANLLGGGGWESEATKNPTLSNFKPDGTYRFDLTSTNEYARLFQETNYRKQQTSSADVKADLEILKGLTASVFGSVTRNSWLDGQYRLKASENSVENTDFPSGGYAYRSPFLSNAFAVEPTITYNKLIDKHNVTALAGYSYRYYLEEGGAFSNRGFINDLFHEDNIAQGSALALGKASMSSFKNDNTLIAFFGRVNYSYNNKYLAQFILRREGSSRFGDQNKWGYFPAASVGWNISDESFMDNVNFVDNLKLRVGYGVTGNSGFANNASRVTLGGGGRYLFPDGQYLETYGPTRNANPNLKWETKHELNVGMDFSLFKTKVNGSLEVFDRRVVDLLDTYTSPQPPFIQSSIYTNVGTISSKGIELAFNYAPINRSNLGWDMDFTGSTLKNVLDSYSNDEYKVLFKTFGGIGGAGALGDAIVTYEGERLGEFWGKRFAGFDATGKWLFYNRKGEKVLNAQINNSRDRAVTDLVKIGNAIPKFYASMTQNLRFKNFDFRVFFRGKFGHDILNTSAISYANKTWSGNLLKSTFDKYSEIKDTYMYSDYYLEKGSYVKLDEITLGYNFKLNTKYIRNMRVYANGQNLATITGYTGSDPDYVPDNGLGPGIDGRGPYPSTRSFMVGLNLGF